MSKNAAFRAADLRGASRLAVDGILGLAQLVEAMHHTIVHTPGVLGMHVPGPTKGITGFTYRSIRRVTRIVGTAIDTALGSLVPAVEPDVRSPRREAVIAALNGVLGDYLADSANSLAIPMRFVYLGRPLELTADALAKAIEHPTGKLLIYIHGLCMNDMQWAQSTQTTPSDKSPAELLANELGCPAIYLHYNTGRHISTNGQNLSMLMEALVDHWPVPLTDVTIIAHSMGGLVTRSACDVAQLGKLPWLSRLKRIVFLGTPHLGAPMERGGNWVDFALGISPYTAPLAGLGKIRSAGITDLRYGNLRDVDWIGRDRFSRTAVRPHPLPLQRHIKCYAIAATVAKRAGGIGEQIVGDGLVPVNSALGRSTDPQSNLAIPSSRSWVAYGINHFDLLNHPKVFERIRRWLVPTHAAGS